MSIQNINILIQFKVDGDTPGERQAQDLIKKLPGILSLKKCEIIGYLQVPNKHMGSLGGALAQYVTIVNEKWGADGCTMEISLVPGDFDTFTAELNRCTKGEYTFNVEGAGPSAPAEPAQTGKKGGRKGKKGKRK